MKQVQEWVESEDRDYAAGVALFAAHGRSGVLKRLLAGACTDYTREVLARELGQLAAAAAPDKPRAVAQPPRPPAPAPVAPDDPDAELRRERRTLFAQRDYLHARLELVATAAERRAMALELLTTAQRIRLSYDVAAGRAVVPEPAPTPDLAALVDAGEVRRLLANLKPLRSKLKKRPDRADDLARVEADILLLETKLNYLK